MTGVFRRDPRIRTSLTRLGRRCVAGIPSPAVQLLLKAKDLRPKDHADVEVTSPLLGVAEQ
jgi:hypothetical protein